jgi:hypothetical protein
LIDNAWFESENIFNHEDGEGWTTNFKKIEFPANKKWTDYINLIRLEVSCGEAPYLVSRYDAVNGEIIDLDNRIGLLDRKFRVLNENCDEHDEWVDYSKHLMKSIYGYDWQGDNILLARENILYTYSDNYKYKFKQKPSIDLIKEIVEIISWNIWQMDGINYNVPQSCKNQTIVNNQLNIFGIDETIIQECEGCKRNNIHKHNGLYSKIMNWETNRTNKFINLVDRNR